MTAGRRFQTFQLTPYAKKEIRGSWREQKGIFKKALFWLLVMLTAMTAAMWVMARMSR